MNKTPNIDYFSLIPEAMKYIIPIDHQLVGHGLDRKLFHLVKLYASQLNRCAFCVNMHVQEALEDGERQSRIDRLIVWRDVEDFTPAERAALAWTEALTILDPREDKAPLREEAKAHFSDGQLAALSAGIALINLWNRINISNH